MNEEDKAKLKSLKEEATALGISFSPNVGLDLLQSRIDEVNYIVNLALTKEREKAKQEAPVAAPTPPAELSKEDEVAAHRNKAIKDATLMKRIIVTCHDSGKLEADRQGEIFMAGNSVVPVVKKFVPYGYPTHVENILIKLIEGKRVQQRYGKGNLKSREVKAYTVEYLDPLTPEEFAELRKLQALRKEASKA